MSPMHFSFGASPENALSGAAISSASKMLILGFMGVSPSGWAELSAAEPLIENWTLVQRCGRAARLEIRPNGDMDANLVVRNLTLHRRRDIHSHDTHRRAPAQTHARSDVEAKFLLAEC